MDSEHDARPNCGSRLESAIFASRVRHTVAFTLVHEEGSAEERDFLDAAEHLANIPGAGGTQTFGAATLDIKWGRRNLRTAQL